MNGAEEEDDDYSKDVNETPTSNYATGILLGPATDRWRINFFGLAKDAEAIKLAVDKWAKDGQIERQFRLSKWQTIPGTVPKILVNYSIILFTEFVCVCVTKWPRWMTV